MSDDHEPPLYVPKPRALLWQAGWMFAVPAALAVACIFQLSTGDLSDIC